MNRQLFGALMALLVSCGSVHAGPLVLAHRGGPAQLPENTLPAFRQALSLGALFTNDPVGLIEYLRESGVRE